MKAYKPKDAVYTRIESGDDWSKVYQHVCGVPTDGTEVEAEAFVLGEARKVTVIRNHENGIVFLHGAQGDRLDVLRAGILFGELPPVGETRRYRIVPETVAAETPSQRAVQAGVPVEEDIPKGADVQEQQRAEVAQKTIDRLKKFSDALEPGKPLEESGYRVTTPVEVPARETTRIKGWRGVDVNGKLAAIYDPGVFSDIDSPPDTRSSSVSIGPTRYWLGHDGEHVTRVHPNVFIHKANHGYQVVLQVGVQYFDVCPRDDDEQHAQFIAAMLAKAVDKLSVPPVAPPVTVATAVPGPRWEKPRYRTVGEFICHINSEDYYVGAVNGEPSIIRVSEFDDGHQYLTCEHGAKNSARLWVEVKPNDKDAKAYRQAYDAALAANKLPPHPRYQRPEGATDFLGWSGNSASCNCYDGWWVQGGLSGIRLGFSDGSGGVMYGPLMTEKDDWGPPYDAPLARARELGLPERDARKARLADLERQRAEIDGQIAELREVSNA